MSEAASGPLPAIAPRVATAADLDPIAATMARALHGSPVWTWVFPDQEQRLRAQHAIWRFTFASTLDYGWAWVLDGTGEDPSSPIAAASLWIPPGKPSLAPGDPQRFASMLDLLLGRRSALVKDMFARFEAAHPHERGPQYYLNLLATDPDHAGHGLGKALLADNLARIDAEGAAAFLETTNPVNVPLYERFGFVALEGFEIPASGLEVAQMWREAR